MSPLRTRPAPADVPSLLASGRQWLFPPVVSAHTRSFSTLQALRAVAAILVVLFHVNVSIFNNPKYFAGSPFGNLLDFGHSGVQLFFVLSGFVIYSAHSNDIGRPGRLSTFAWKRFRRIYPVYWMILLFIGPVFFLVPGFGSGFERDAGVLLDSALLVHLAGHGHVVLTTSWTLFHEMLFYALFALVILHRRLGAAVLATWLLASAFGAPQTTDAYGLNFVFSRLHLLFGMGVAAAWLLKRRHIPAPAFCAAAGAVLFFGTGLLEVHGAIDSSAIQTPMYGAGATLLIAGAVELERRRTFHLPRMLCFLGDASYSIYLVHVLALSILGKAAAAAVHAAPVPHLAIFAGLAVGATGAGVVAHFVIERPLLAWLQQMRISPSIVLAVLPGRFLASVDR